MGKALCLCFLSLLLLLQLSSFLASQSSPALPQLRCLDEERSALLELQTSFGKDDDPGFTCFGSGQAQEEVARNCCSWKGVECGGPSSHVIGLDLMQCSYDYGSIDSNSSIFRLVHLQRLYLDLMDFSNSSMPASLGNLQELRELTLSECNFQGAFPSSVSNLTQLVTLDISANFFTGTILPFVSNLTRLEVLSLDGNQFTGDIPTSIRSLTQLTTLDLDSNQFTGEIPPQLSSLTRLQELDLSFNNFRGVIPASLSELWNLSSLSLGPNNLSGTVKLDMFTSMENLEQLILSFNGFSLDFESAGGYSLPNVKTLGLAQCNLNEFPEFLEKLGNLTELDLSYNNLSGEVPEWFLSERLPTLSYLNLSYNSLTGFPQELSHYNSSQLEALDLRFNKLQGSFPFTSAPILNYLVSNNMLSGEISPRICEWEYSAVIDISKNNFTGELPQCLGNIGENFRMIAMHSNNFHGRIPPFGNSTYQCGLQMIDLSDNQFEGPLPRAMSNCSELTFLNMGNNRIRDTFPTWLGNLSSLRVLILRSNEFHGEIVKPETDPGFSKLQIIDLSHNYFAGHLPALYFQNWKYMGMSSPERNYYLSGYIYSSWVVAHDYPTYDFSMTIVNKGVELEYGKILGYFKVVDLSSNNFTGNIPDLITSLQGLHLLNFSNNMLTGSIPSSLGGLVGLEALDVSQNELSGEIPPQLTQLNFLAIFNVSYNNLSGAIPRGKQFNSFQSSSYLGNEGLCGDPVSRKCGNQTPPTPPSHDGNDADSDGSFHIEWKAVAIGYATTFAIAALIGHWIITKRPNWFARNFGLKPIRRRR